ncbi:hypothetical protein AKJ09_08656 [Labilithrix luteola]|uniref:Uncharacterized protein n=1 Tax=Labilithrix luteola TaxID=1391654 RepID=A0A0K1Q8C6_9BACT|nr:hypothetical protein AKJ09_08656 [Labilithrix luteola]
MREHDDVPERKERNRTLLRSGFAVVSLEEHWLGFYLESQPRTNLRRDEISRSKRPKSTSPPWAHRASWSSFLATCIQHAIALSPPRLSVPSRFPRESRVQRARNADRHARASRRDANGCGIWLRTSRTSARPERCICNTRSSAKVPR